MWVEDDLTMKTWNLTNFTIVPFKIIKNMNNGCRT